MKLIDKSDERLYSLSSDVEIPFGLKTKTLIRRMFKTMKTQFGIGLAAPQVGVNVNLFVMYMDGQPVACVNPTIISASDEISEMYEGCLSFPEVRILIKRPSDVNVRFFNANGRLVIKNLSGIEARCFQHELDHLSGITMMRRHELNKDL